ncbi:ImpA family metalloprotease [Ideonella margarita]|uniref:ImpA family metalloprotease n=1 Tax=Ideonella margarita TaxID=2984191 RepID=A0ABU9C3L3_9BURK
MKNTPVHRSINLDAQRRPKLPLWPAMALGLALAACGGGGGGGETGGGNTAGGGDTTPPVVVDPQVTALSAALSSGNAKDVTLATVSASVQTELKSVIAAYGAVRQSVYGLNADGSANANSLGAIDWNPTHDSTTLNVLDQGRNHVFMPSNWRYTDNAAGTAKALAVAGTAPTTGARYAAFGGNPMGVPGNAAMDSAVRNTIGWLTGRTSFDNFKVVTAHLPGDKTYWWPHEGKVRTWLNTQFPGVTINGVAATAATDDSCDGDKLNACLQGANLLIIGRQQGPNVSGDDVFPAGYNADTVMSAVTAAQARGIPVLYLHHYRDANTLAARLLEYFGLSVSNNYWSKEGLKTFDPATQPNTPATPADWLALVQRLEANNFTTDWTGCFNDLGRTLCEANGTTSGNAALINEFTAPGKALRSQLRALDAQGVALFSQPGYALEKRMVLLGDKYRESVSYPMTRTADRQAFFQAYFSDFTAYINRPANAVARNLGNFSGLFPATTPTISKLVSANSPETGSREYMTGLYVMPGRTVTLQRTDSGTQGVTVGLNMLRDTTHVYDTYDRPTQLASPRVPLVAGKTVTLTSPFGGPVYLFLSAATGAPAVTVQIDGGITHPVLRNPDNAAEVAAFKAEIASTPTNWVGLTTDFLTVHSNLTNFRKTLATYNDDMAKLVSNMWTYTIKDTYELAGFNSATAGTFTLAPTVSAFCTAQGWDCTGTQHRRDVMQHLISDNYAACGAGCSGNPYDQSWALEPLGWGESHEIGHNLQRSRLNIYGGLSTEVSNNIFPIHKQMMFNKNTLPASPLSRSGSAKAPFDLMKTALATSDPIASMKAAMWTDSSYGANGAVRLMFYRQLVEYARIHRSGTFNDGWELYTLLYLLDRNMGAAQSSWATSAAGLGFGTYAAYPSSMDGNDFMVIATSRIIGRDMRPVFDLWGITYTASASAQVAAYGYTAAEKLLFPMINVQQYGAGVGTPITMTTTATYPAGF